MPTKTEILKLLQSIPNVGKAVSDDLYKMGYRSIGDFEKEDPDMMYVKHNDQKGKVQDICMLYTFRAIVYFAKTYGGPQDREKLKWWNWMDKKKMSSKDKDTQIRMKKNLRPIE
jgi:hypothetical protein